MAFLTLQQRLFGLLSQLHVSPDWFEEEEEEGGKVIGPRESARSPLFSHLSASLLGRGRG